MSSVDLWICMQLLAFTSGINQGIFDVTLNSDSNISDARFAVYLM